MMLVDLLCYRLTAFSAQNGYHAAGVWNKLKRTNSWTCSSTWDLWRWSYHLKASF